MDLDLESIILQGNTGYFYMEVKNWMKWPRLKELERYPNNYSWLLPMGVVLMQVQIMGFDPQTDFTISPWVKDSYDGVIQEGDVISGIVT